MLFAHRLYSYNLLYTLILTYNIELPYTLSTRTVWKMFGKVLTAWDVWTWNQPICQEHQVNRWWNSSAEPHVPNAPNEREMWPSVKVPYSEMGPTKIIHNKAWLKRNRYMYCVCLYIYIYWFIWCNYLLWIFETNFGWVPVCVCSPQLRNGQFPLQVYLSQCCI